MVADHHKRATNSEELLRCLKEVNQIIQQASRLRLGTFRTQVGCESMGVCVLSSVGFCSW